ncbi:MAG: neocarzinostatin apoprotein domain-containing protein [Acidimicrobiia bacterium]
MKARALSVATLAVIATLFPAVGPALADSPEGGTPGTSVTVTPDDNLPATASVTVSGVGFRASWTAEIRQCGVQPGLDLVDCVDRTTALTTAAGALNPVQIQVTSTFQPAGGPAVNCLTTNCFVNVTTEEKNARHHLTFSGGIAAPQDVVSDFDGNLASDVAIYRPSTGQWFINAQPLITWGGLAGDIPVPADYTGDQRTDAAIYRPNTGQWFIHGGNPGLVTWGGLAGDIPVPADYTGDNRADPAIYRPNTGQWFIHGGNPGLVTWGGLAGDIPVPGDYTGDGRADAAIYRPNTGQWFIHGGNPALVTWGGLAGDIPVPGDYNGDGRTDVAIYRSSNGQWWIRNVTMVPWGTSTDIPLPLPYAIRRVFF